MGRALAARGKAAMGGEESQIQSTMTVDSAEVRHDLARAVSEITNPGIESTLEMVESAEKKSEV